MATLTIAEMSQKRDWGDALAALKMLRQDDTDTAQIYRIIRALNAGNSRVNYNRLLATWEGGTIANDRVELSKYLTDSAFMAQFEAGTVGAAYRSLVATSGYSADGLAKAGAIVDQASALSHPYAWYGRRERNMLDIWHVLTGYEADNGLSEACLVGFCYGQTKGLGWAAIAAWAALRAFSDGVGSGRAAAKAIWEGYRNGRNAAWLSGEDCLKLLGESLEAARWRLDIPEPAQYHAAKALADD